MKSFIPLFIVLMIVSTSFIGISNKTEELIKKSHLPTELIIDGPTLGKVGVQYNYTIYLIEPEDDIYFIRFNYGDGEWTEWLGPYSSYEKIIMRRTWQRSGVYTIQAEAKCNGSYYYASLEVRIVDGNILYVGGSGPGNYTNIQDAIDNATDGDTVFVYNGTYDLTYNDIYIYNSINLIGENKVNTIINGSDINAIWVMVSKVLIDGFTFLHSGIGIFNSNQITITDNIINGSGISFGSISIGMFYSNTNNNTISNNSFFNGGLTLWGYHNLVYNNTVNGKPLVYLESTSDKTIDNAGQVILIDCSNITVQNINISYTDVGIQLYECTNCYIKSNLLSYNSFLGISLINSTYNNISDNIIDKNDFAGLSIVYGENNNISSNSFQNGDFLNLILYYSSDNLFSKNNFIFNSSFSRLKNIIYIESDNKWKANYWNESRKLPVFIWGFKIIKLFRYRPRPCIDIDWHPAKEPYNI